MSKTFKQALQELSPEHIERLKSSISLVATIGLDLFSKSLKTKIKSTETHEAVDSVLKMLFKEKLEEYMDPKTGIDGNPLENNVKKLEIKK